MNKEKEKENKEPTKDKGNINNNKNIENGNQVDDQVDDDKEIKIVEKDKKPFNLEFFLLFAFVIMLGIDIYNTRIDYFNLSVKKIMNGGYTDEFGVGGIQGVRSEFFGPNISNYDRLKYVCIIILFFILVVSISFPFSLLIALIVICYVYGKKNVIRIIKSVSK